MHLTLRLAFVFTLTACHGGGDNSPSGVGIPTDIPFNEKSLPGINDADLAQAKVVAQVAGQASAPKGIEGVPRAGEVYKSSESNVTTGAQFRLR